MSERSDETSDELFAGLAPRLMLLLIRRFGMTRDAAADAAQDAFVTVLARGLDTLPEDLSHRWNYIAKTAISRAVDRIRNDARRNKSESVLWAAISDDVETRAIDSQQTRLLRDAIDKLQTPYREIFTLLIREELPLVQVAARLGTASSSIYKQYERGIAELRKHIRNG